ncbi:MAG: S46 family peptidase [Melioribacteraceae bacterium]|nr:MAG: S46 family peptidase [Melioribacteraceae bacterium]
MNSVKFKSLFSTIFILLFLASSSFAQSVFNPDTVKAKRFDTGKMWTFDYPPYEYWKTTYDFDATEEWIKHVQLATLRIPGCTASFVSEDGLIVTNHHCSTWHRDAVEEESEDFYRDGFYAESLDEERLVPNMYADQLKLIRDVTDQILDAIHEADGDENKIKARDEKIKEIENMYNEETGLKCEVVSYYNGGKYALHGYKRYDKVKLVFIGEDWVGMYGGDPDNFTYPRYNLDYAFFRIYDEDDKPLKTENYYNWNTSGVELDELLFIIGSPGSTNRLKTADQLRYYRDITYRNYSFLMTSMLDEIYSLLDKYPERQDEFAGMLSMVGNSEKVARNIVKGLNDPYLIARKEAFDKKLQEEIAKDSDLQKNYGHLWNSIKENRDEARKYAEKVSAYTVSGRLAPAYFKIAKDMIELANELKLPEEERNPKYKEESLEETINSIYPAKFDQALEDAKLKVQLDYIRLNLGNDDPMVKLLSDNKSGYEAVEYAKSNSVLTSAESIKEIAIKGHEAILESEDVFIQFILGTSDELKELQAKYDQINEAEKVLSQTLGEVMFSVYGTSIPPDANRSMRIGDGQVKQVEYNGTIAPYHTTFYGLFDRYYSHNKKFPWDLPERWVNYPDDFNLSTPVNFITDIDVIGGQSGSPIVNRAGEFVGVAFDGNIESIIGNFIFMPESNRSITVAAEGIVQALRYIYKADRLVKEIENNKIVK